MLRLEKLLAVHKDDALLYPVLQELQKLQEWDQKWWKSESYQELDTREATNMAYRSEIVINLSNLLRIINENI